MKNSSANRVASSSGIPEARSGAPGGAPTSASEAPSPEAPSPAKGHGRGRRRLAYVIGFLVMIPLGFFVNAGPYQDYQQVREQLRAEEEEVALLENENATYVGEIERLQKDSYVEALARRELTYARPGEDVFIVKNLPDGPVETAERSAEETGGPLESMVRSLGGLF